MTYDDATLMAFADGELDAALRAEISAAVARDPALARRVDQHRALRAEVAAAFEPVLSQPVPERLLAGAQDSATAERTSRGTVVQVPARGAPAPSAPWRAREWSAMAASVMLGVLISWKLFAPGDSTLVTVREGTVVARGALARALDQQLASGQTGTEAVLIGLTFRTPEGQYCRSVTARAAATAGLACRTQGEWRVPVLDVAPEASDVRQAASPPPVVLQAIEARIVGEPLDAAGEENARRGGWEIARP